MLKCAVLTLDSQSPNEWIKCKNKLKQPQKTTDRWSDRAERDTKDAKWKCVMKRAPQFRIENRAHEDHAMALQLKLSKSKMPVLVRSKSSNKKIVIFNSVVHFVRLPPTGAGCCNYYLLNLLFTLLIATERSQVQFSKIIKNNAIKKTNWINEAKETHQKSTLHSRTK